MPPGNARFVHLAGILLAAVLPAHQAAAAPQACTQQYEPVCARRTLIVNCVRAPCPRLVDKRTYANACLARADGATVLHAGPCDAARRPASGCRRPGDPAADPDCRSWTDGCNICRRAAPGAPPTCTKMTCSRRAAARCLLHFGERP